jgi:O-antigen ligase
MALLLLIPVAIYWLITSDFWFRMEAALEVVQGGDRAAADGSLAGRIWLYQRAMEVALENPLIGIGLDNFRDQTGTQIGQRIGTYTHSNYMEVLVSTGLVGFLIYFSIYWLWLRKLIRCRGLVHDQNHFAAYLRVVTVVLAYVIMDFTTVSYYSKLQWLVFPWVIAELETMRATAGARDRSPQRALRQRQPPESHHAGPGGQPARRFT